MLPFKFHILYLNRDKTFDIQVWYTEVFEDCLQLFQKRYLGSDDKMLLVFKVNYVLCL
jgi:hypothetical protein